MWEDNEATGQRTGEGKRYLSLSRHSRGDRSVPWASSNPHLFS